MKEKKKPFYQHIATVSNLQTGQAIHPSGELVNQVNFEVEGIDPEHLKNTFGGSVVDGKWIAPE